MAEAKRAWAVTIEVDGRQNYVLGETEKLQEMLGASRIIDGTRREADALFGEAGSHVFGPVSGEIRAWAPADGKEGLLRAAFAMRLWLEARGVPHSCGVIECRADHFEVGDLLPAPREAPDPWHEPARPSLTWVHAALSARCALRKHAKTGEDARPTCSLFAPCRVHGTDAANHWWPEGAPDMPTDETRRRLVSDRAWSKVTVWREERSAFYYDQLLQQLLPAIRAEVGKHGEGELPLNIPPRAVDFSDLAADDATDSYIALACADGDGMSRVLAGLDWNSAAWGDARPAWQRNRDFADAYDKCVKAAFRAALLRVIPTAIVPDKTRAAKLVSEADKAAKGVKDARLRLRIPVLPQLLGGDDLWMVASRSVAMSLVREFIDQYASEAAKPGPLATALEVARRASPHAPLALTVSAGIAFAKAGHPADAMIASAEALMKSAKRLRKGKAWRVKAPSPPEGCLDWHWIESSRTEAPEEARAHGARYEHDGVLHLLTTRPWTASQSAGFETAARLFRDGIARRKREQLEAILRLGKPLSELAWEGWLQGLQDEEPQKLLKVNEALPQEWRLPADGKGRLLPWRDLPGAPMACATPLIDLLLLQDILAAGASVSEPREVADASR